MPKSSILDWDATAANNTDVGGINIAEGCAAANINNAMREIMAQVKSGVDYKTVASAKSTNYTAVAADNNSVIRFSAAATLSLTAAATLGANWHAIVHAYGGAVVVDPNGSETINGATTFTIAQGDDAFIYCNGTTFFATTRFSTSANNTFSGTATYTVGGQTITMRSAAVGVGPVFMRFQDSAGTNLGYIGLGSALDRLEFTRNTVGEIRINPVAGGTISLLAGTGGTLALTGDTFTYNGSAIPLASLITGAGVAANVAAIAAGGVGSIAQAYRNAAVAFGATTAGSNLTISNNGSGTDPTTLSGTWRCLGVSLAASTVGTIWLRIS